MRNESGKDNFVNLSQPFVPFINVRSSMEEALRKHWGVKEADDEIQARRIGREHLAPERTPPPDVSPELNFSLLFKHNNPWPEPPLRRQLQQQRTLHHLEPTPPKRWWASAYDSDEEEAQAGWDARSARANSRTFLIPKNQRPVSEPETENSPATIMGKYYGSFMSKMSYRVMLGGRKHLGYYPKDTYWLFPIKKALRAMEDCLMDSLGVQPGGTIVLDTGCGEGHVAMHLARHGQMRVHCIDIVERFVFKMQRNIMKGKLEESVTVEKMDYNKLSSVGETTFDGVFAMETICHATNPEGVFAEFLRVLKPKGTLVLHEFARSAVVACPENFMASAEMFTSLKHVTLLQEKTLENMVKQQGFKDVVVEDVSVHIMPLLRLFFAMAYVPLFFIRHYRLRRFFVHPTSAVILYEGMEMGYWRYIVVKGRKPGPIDIAVGRSKSTTTPKRVFFPRNEYDWPFH